MHSSAYLVVGSGEVAALERTLGWLAEPRGAAAEAASGVHGSRPSAK